MRRWSATKDLMEVERAFRDLKDVIEMRPIYHQTKPFCPTRLPRQTLGDMNPGARWNRTIFPTPVRGFS